MPISLKFTIWVQMYVDVLRILNWKSEDILQSEKYDSNVPKILFCNTSQCQEVMFALFRIICLINHSLIFHTAGKRKY